MNKYIYLFVFAALMAISCKEEKRESGEDSSAHDSFKPQQNDSTYDEWGEPAPPPDVDGDGSSLFAERKKKIVDVELIDDEDAKSDNNDRLFEYDDVIRNRINNSTSYTPVQNTTSRPTPKSQPRNTSGNNHSLEYNSSDGYETVETGSGKAVLLPYAANNEEKIDFIKSFYETALTKGVNMVDDNVLSVSCRNYLIEQCYGNHFSVESFFGISSSDANRQPAELLKSMSVKPLGDDWFKVSFDNDKSSRPVELKIVEMDRKLMVDMVR